MWCRMWKSKERKNEINKGKKCKEPDCNFIAKVKGYCLHCYIKNRYVRVRKIKMTYKKDGVDIEKEEQAIKELLSSITSTRKGTGRPLGGHYAGLIRFDINQKEKIK